MRAVTSPDWWDVPGRTFARLPWSRVARFLPLGLVGARWIRRSLHGSRTTWQRLPIRYTYVRKFRNKNARLFSMTIGYCQTSDDDLLYGSCCPAKTYRRAVGHLAEWRDCGPV